MDGISISPKEAAHAKEIYQGKLTIELLGEKLGHFAFKNLSDLDLRNCRIKEIDCFSSGDFRSLRRLNLDNNQISTIEPLLSLTSVKFLSLNNNRIEKLAGFDADPKTQIMFFPNLLECQLGFNLVSRMSELGLSRFKTLKVLYLQGNKIAKVSGILFFQLLTRFLTIT